MLNENDFWSQLSTYEQLKETKARAIEGIDFHVEKTNSCLNKCKENIEELNYFLKSANLPQLEESARLQDTVLHALSRAKDFTTYWRNNIQGDLAELNLMENLIKSQIDTRYSGKTTAIDLFARVQEKDKMVLIQVKSTRDSNRKIEKQEVIDLLVDSLFFCRYPVIDVAFYADNAFEHFLIPIEEIIGKLKYNSISISRNRLSKFVNLDFDNFKNV